MPNDPKKPPAEDTHAPVAGQTSQTSSGVTLSAVPAGGQRRSSADARAHLINRGNIERRLDEDGPGSLNPSDLAPPTSAEERRFFAKRGVELHVPPWLFLGLVRDGKGAAYNHTGTADGHALEFSFWRLPDGIGFEKLLASYLGEEMDDLKRLGRIKSHEVRQVGGVQGLLMVGAGPESAEQLASIDPEELFLATDGTGRRSASWRGPVGDMLLIVSMTSPVENAFEAMPVFEEVLKRLRFSADSKRP